MKKTTSLYRKMPDGLVLLLLQPMGAAARGLANHSPGRALIDWSLPLLGRAMVGMGRKTNLFEKRGCVDIAGETVRKFFAPGLEIVEDTPARFEYTLEKCPYKLHSAGQLELCHSMMKWDEALVAALGGRMEIIDRIPEGKPLCRMRITNNG
jgi:hypothetical protein